MVWTCWSGVVVWVLGGGGGLWVDGVGGSKRDEGERQG